MKSKTPKNENSLFSRIGGASILNATVDAFYKRMLDDPLINHFFKNIDVKRQKKKMFSFLRMLLGGNINYQGKKMSEAHAHLNIKESHFNAFIAHLDMTLESVGLDQELIDEVIDITLSVKEDVMSYNKNKTSIISNKKTNNTDMAQENNDIYKALLQEAADAVVTIDETKNIIFWNAAAEKLWGYSAGEAIGKNIKYFVPHEHQSAHDHYVDQNLQTGVNKIVGKGREVEVQRKDGSRVPVLLTMTKVQQGNKTFYMGIVKDITIEKRERERNLQILEEAVDAVVTINGRTKAITFFNKAAEKMWGYSRNEVLGKNVNTVVPMNLKGVHDGYVDANIRTGENKIIGKGREVELERKDGSRLWVNLSLSKVEMGEEILYNAFLKDISVQKKMILDFEQAKREIDVYKSLVNEACLVSETDIKGYITYVNDKFCDVAQYTEAELIGANQNIVRHPSMPKTLFKELWSTIGRGKIFRGLVTNKKKDGSPYYVDGIFAPVLGANGKPIKYIGIRYDITESTVQNFNMQGLKDTVDTSFAEIEFDSKGRILDVNQNFVNTLGYNRTEDLIGEHHSMFVENSYKNSAEYLQFWRDLANGIVQSGEFKRISKQGTEVWIQAAYTPVKSKDGIVEKVIKIATDITAQKQLLIDINKVIVLAGEEGKLDARMDVSNATGDWKDLANSVNLLLESIANPVVEINRVVGEMAKGNLSESFELEAEGDLKELGGSLNTAIGSLNMLLGQISQIGNLVAASAEEMLAKGEAMKKTTQEVASATQQMAEGAQQQAQQTDETSKLMDDVLQSANGMAEKAGLIDKAAEDGQKSSTEGLSTIKLVVDNMNEIQESAESTSESINILSERSDEIASALSVITDIAAQTNLLALNAAIEAARAGDAGRGFAVVAEEIRKLAEGSRKSAVDIEKVIREVQKDITTAAKAIDAMSSSVKSGTSASKEAEEVFGKIEAASNGILDLSKEIVDVTDEQKGFINVSVQNIEKIVVVAEETASGTEQIASSGKVLSQGMNEVTATSEDLANIANQLQESISKFKLK